MPDDAIVCQPISTAPRDGTPVVLVMQHETRRWRTPTPFRWVHGRWRAVVSDIPVSGAAEVVGWDRIGGDDDAG